MTIAEPLDQKRLEGFPALFVHLMLQDVLNLKLKVIIHLNWRRWGLVTTISKEGAKQGGMEDRVHGERRRQLQTVRVLAQALKHFERANPLGQ